MSGRTSSMSSGPGPAGNMATTEITVTRMAPTTPTIRVVSGSGQTGPVGTQLAAAADCGRA